MNTFYKRLLVIDDEVQMCDLVTEVAGDRGFETAQVTTHADFKRLLHEFRPMFIVMDLSMPDGDGVELLRFLSAERSEASIILISGFDQTVLNAAKQLGVDRGLNLVGALQKPIMIAELEALLTEMPKLGHEVDASELMAALECDQIDVFYQPKVLIGAGSEHTIKDVEALVRWRHPERGLLTPDTFLGIASRANLMLPLTRAVVGKAFRQVGAWREKGLELAIAINIAPELLNNLELPDEIAALSREHGVPPDQVMVEITESGVMEDAVLAMDILTRFRIKGFRLSIDDVGTGYSSLAQLYKMPFSELKIDQTFVGDVTKSEEARFIVTTTANMAHGLGLTVCAEGVEDAATYEFLKSCKCEKLQGYLISRPIDGDAMHAFGATWRLEKQGLQEKTGS